ncbi:MAG: T9SS type A sorting domain-containing protein [Muribaculaceae bacterium]
MKKIYSLITLVALTSVAASAYHFVTPGNGTRYTLESLSAMPESGIVKDANIYTLVNDSLEISAGDVLQLDNNAVLRLGDKAIVMVYGHCDFAQVDTATITRTDADATPKGFYLRENGTIDAKHVNFEYTQLRTAADKPITLANCTFQYADTKLNSSGAVILTGSCDGNIIENCRFIKNVSSAVGGAANCPTGVIIRNCYLYDNNTGNSNRPQLNITVGCDYDVEITGNTIIGTERTKVGAISVANMLGLAGANKALIKGNRMMKNRYGITTLGALDVKIIDNIIVDNKYDPNPMNGGSGISIYDSNNKQTCYVEGNYIEGNLWGVTIIGCGNVNLGKIEDKTAADYNPGRNVFKNNGNSDVPYDLYNNSAYTIYAQGNIWSVATQDEASIETVIFHQKDDSRLGEVIFMPAQVTTGVEDVKAATLSYNSGVVYTAEPSEIVVFNAAGAVVASSDNAVSEFSLENLASGLYIVKANSQAIKIMK